MKQFFIIVSIIMLLGITVKAQSPEPTGFKKYFSGLTWSQYFCQKTTALALDYQNYQLSDNSEKFIDSEEEDDSLFVAEVIKYLQNTENLKKSITMVSAYVKKNGYDKYITDDTIVAAIKETIPDEHITKGMEAVLNSFRKYWDQ